ncbi:MAG TPA: cadmium resistance transporter [Steroidobacteraceae bacterium]|nr:cadmium resistance transporter [Steroidobacteraceae bacterium]
MLEDLLTAIVVFVVTNVDDLLLLALLFGGGLRVRAVVAGQFLGITVLTGVSVGAAYAATVIPEKWINLLGLVPIVLGSWLLFRLWRAHGRTDDDRVDISQERLDSAPGAQALGVAALTIANGGDNVGVYIPLFANDAAAVPVFTVVFLVFTAVWCALGYALIKHPVGAAVTQRWGHLLLPFVLIGIGIHILL